MHRVKIKTAKVRIVTFSSIVKLIKLMTKFNPLDCTLPTNFMSILQSFLPLFFFFFIIIV